MTAGSPISHGTKRSPLVALLLRGGLVIAVATYLCSSLYSPLLYEQLAIGNWITAHRAVPQSELWTALGEGEPWRATTWLFAALLSVVESSAGELGLVALKMLLQIAVVAMLGVVCSRRAENPFVGTLLAVIAACGLLVQSPLDANLLGWLLLLLTVEGVYGYYESRAPRTRTLVTLFLLGALHANVHSSSLFAAALAVWLATPEHRLGRSRLLVPLALALAQLLTPYFGLQAASALRSFADRFSLAVFYQSDAATIYDFRLAFLLLLLLLLGLLWHARSDQVRARDALLVGFSCLFGFAASFLLPYALLAVVIVAATHWGRCSGKKLGNLGEGIHRLRDSLSKVSPSGLLWVLLCVIAVNIGNLIKVPATLAVLPSVEVDYLLEHDLPSPVLHDALTGSYLVYRFADGAGRPRRLAAFSGRSADFLPDAARADVLLQRLSKGWEDTVAGAAPNTVLCRRYTPMCELFLSDPQWETVMEERTTRMDGTRTVHEPRSAIPWMLLTRRNQSTPEQGNAE